MTFNNESIYLLLLGILGVNINERKTGKARRHTFTAKRQRQSRQRTMKCTQCHT